MIIQLSPCIPIMTPRGSALAHFLIDYGPEYYLQWTVFLDDSGECWTYQNPEIRAQKNITQGREYISAIDSIHMKSNLAHKDDKLGHKNMANDANEAKSIEEETLLFLWRTYGDDDVIEDSLTQGAKKWREQLRAMVGRGAIYDP